MSIQISPLKYEDVRSIQDFKNYFIREGIRYVLNKEGEQKHNMNTYFCFIFEHQNFVKEKSDKIEICSVIKSFIKLQKNK